MNKIYLAGGCFWCISDYLKSFKGISKVVVGYCGGDEHNVSYNDVKEQRTGHRETVEVYYDNSISKEDILDIFVSYVDLFDPDGQYIDKGFSYTLALYYQDEKEKQLFTNKIQELEKTYDRKVYVAIEPFKFFINAEEYHQDYSNKNPNEFYEELVNSNRVCHLKLFKKN